MRLRQWLCWLTLLCMIAPCALAEATEAADAPEAQAAPVDASVEEVALELGGDSSAPDLDALLAAEDWVEDAEITDDWDAEDYYLDCPDIYDDSLRKQLTPSDRVYPGVLVWPLPGQTPLVHISSHVGWRDANRIHRRQGGAWASWLHHGVDVGGVDTSQAVVAAADGLAYAGARNGIGNYVVIDHGNGWYTRCQHLSCFAGDVFEDCRAVPVRAGDVIGYVGCSGGDYPVHFHFEIAWSPEGAGSDDRDFQRETHNRKIVAYSFPQQHFVEMHWPETWELCTAENQNFVEAPLG